MKMIKLYIEKKFISAAQVLAGGCRAASVRSSHGCPVPDTAGFSWLQWPHCRARPIPLLWWKVYVSRGRTLPDSEKWGKKTHSEHQGGQRRAKRCSRCPRRNSLQPLEKEHSAVDIHTAACRRPHAKAGGPALKEAEASGEHTLEQIYPEGLQPVGRPHAVAGKKCEKEGMAERSCYGLSVTHIPHLLAPLGEKRWGGRVKLSLGQGRKEGVSCRFKFCLCFSPSNTILIGNKFSEFFPSQVCFVYDHNW